MKLCITVFSMETLALQKGASLSHSYLTNLRHNANFAERQLGEVKDVTS